ncbi:MAG: DUF2520 domain-containing protein [Bdellovibrionales bacterium]
MKNKNLLVVGNGRLATSILPYLLSVGHEVDQLDRKTLENQLKFEKHYDLVIVLVSDSAISDVVSSLRKLNPFESQYLHMSGALNIEGVSCVHPCMSFGIEALPVENWDSIPFAVFDKSLNHFFPTMNNPELHIPVEHKALYHALCVCAANLPQIIWSETFKEAEKIPMDPSLFLPLIDASLKNLFRSGEKALTGPIHRKDENTMKSNLNSIESTLLKSTYQHLKNTYQDRTL